MKNENEKNKNKNAHANEIYNSLKNDELKIIIEEYILEAELEKNTSHKANIINKVILINNKIRNIILTFFLIINCFNFFEVLFFLIKN